VTSPYLPPERLTPDHQLERFDCGSDSQTIWLRQNALQSQQSHDNVVMVVRRTSDSRVVGFYAISVGSLLRQDAPRRLLQGAGGYSEIGVIILTRLGVDLEEQGRGLGRSLLRDALRRVNALSNDVGFREMLIHAEDDEAKAFYLRQARFEESPTDPLHLILLLKDLRKVISE
jgi:GNAT superfamily N-acetyltransferase